MPTNHRWGSEEAFETVLRQRKAKAETSYEARRQAYAAQQAQQAHAPALTVATDTTGRDYAIDHGHQHATPASRRPCPTYPRILNLGKETNYVGVNQQQFHAVTGEKYGYFTVVNDGFFDSGPKVSDRLALRPVSPGSRHGGEPVSAPLPNPQRRRRTFIGEVFLFRVSC